MIRLLFLIFITLCILNCSPKSDILRSYKSSSPFITVNADNSFHIFSECNIYIKPITQNDWKKLLAYEPFKNKIKQYHYRLPSIHFFMIIIENRERMPVKIKDITVSYGSDKKSMVTLKDINERFNVLNYKRINYKELFTYRKIKKNFEITTFNKIKLQDLIPMHLSFIHPYDKVFRVIAFDWIPVQFRSIKISFILKYLKNEKVIDFNLTRYEYRPAK